MPPWRIADRVAGLALGLALAAMAVDYGRHAAPTPAPLPPAGTLTLYPGP